MELTKYIVSHREQALLLGDYNAYRAQLSRRLHSLRKKLGRTSAKGKKYVPPSGITSEDIENNHEYIPMPAIPSSGCSCTDQGPFRFAQLLLLIAERAWAQAMYVKVRQSTKSNTGGGTTGTTRKYIISRMCRAAASARNLLEVLRERSATQTVESDILEARAYSASLDGAAQFERGRWDGCLTSYSEARIIYASLLASTKQEVFKEVMTSTVDPSIRYAAYQLQIPRSLAIHTIAKQKFSQSDKDLVSTIEKLDPGSLGSEAASSTKKGRTADVSDTAAQTITWRSRTVNIEHASIASALGAVSAASERLSEILSSPAAKELSAADRATAYDDLLIACQDSVDATKEAIEELANEGVTANDGRMQALLITRTAVMYDLLSWRIGRNRTLTGSRDGMHLEDEALARRKSKRATSGKTGNAKGEGKGKKLARLAERAVLYGSTLQVWRSHSTDV